MKLNLLGQDTGLAGFGRYFLATADGACAAVDKVAPTKTYSIGSVVTTQGAGAPLSYELADGPLRVAGSPTIDADVTNLGVDSRAFFALSVGTTPADAQIVHPGSADARGPQVDRVVEVGEPRGSSVGAGRGAPAHSDVRTSRGSSALRRRAPRSSARSRWSTTCG